LLLRVKDKVAINFFITLNPNLKPQNLTLTLNTNPTPNYITLTLIQNSKPKPMSAFEKFLRTYNNSGS